MISPIKPPPIIPETLPVRRYFYYKSIPRDISRVAELVFKDKVLHRELKKSLLYKEE